MARGVAIDPSVDRSMDRFVYAGSVRTIREHEKESRQWT